MGERRRAGARNKPCPFAGRRRSTALTAAAMPDYQAVRCFLCGAFQVQQVKSKSNKFGCRMCGEKQSVLKVGRGCAASLPSNNRRSVTVRSTSSSPPQRIPRPWTDPIVRDPRFTRSVSGGT